MHSYREGFDGASDDSPAMDCKHLPTRLRTIPRSDARRLYLVNGAVDFKGRPPHLGVLVLQVMGIVMRSKLPQHLCLFTRAKPVTCRNTCICKSGRSS